MGVAVEFYALSYKVFRGFPYDLRRVASQAIASSDSVHRNIAEGYCRRSIREYIHFLYIALASLGESVSGVHAYAATGQITDDDFHNLDSLAYRLENGLLRLVEALEQKRDDGDWIDQMVIRESNTLYSADTSHEH